MNNKLKDFAAWFSSPTGVAVNSLGITQIVSWGTTLYALAVLAGPIGSDTGWSPSIVFGGLSIGLLVSGAISTWTGYLLDTRGARSIMSIGSILNALGLVALAYAPDKWTYLAAWAFLGISMRFTLYDAAFAALVQITPQNGRRAISFLTLWGGFASTIFWPIGHALNEAVGWRETCLIFAVLNLLVCLPLHWYGLSRREDEGPSDDTGDDAQQAASGEPGYLKGAERAFAMVLFSI
ncbi:MAG: MFS transporter, partial [Pseudomonadota bacterium]